MAQEKIQTYRKKTGPTNNLRGYHKYGIGT
jgi:hypothetical protein